MISITKLTIPTFLHNSGFYQSLATNECESFEVPATAFKENLVLSDEKEVESLLSTLRFWMVDEIPLELIEYSLRADAVPLAKTFASFSQELTYLPHLLTFSKQFEDIKRLEKAIMSGRTDLVRYVLDHAEEPVNVTLTRHHCELALKAGNSECLALLHARGCPWYKGKNCTDSVPCLLLALQHSPHYVVDIEACIRDEKVTVLDALLALGNPCWGEDTARSAAARGQLSMLCYMHQRSCTAWTGVTSAAAKAGHVKILQFAYEHGLPWDPDTTSAAAESNEVECLAYAHEHGALWCVYVTLFAARNGALPCLIYAHEHDCPWTFCGVADHSSTLHAAASRCYWCCFRYALEHRCPYSVNVAATVARYSLRVLKYVREERGCDWDLQACMEEAAANKNTPCLLYLLSQANGLPIDDFVLSAAAESGDLANLKLVCRESVIPSEQLCIAAAGGSAECLEYVHNLGGILKYSALCEAAEKGRLDCLKYLVEHGCPLTNVARAPTAIFGATPGEIAAEKGHIDCLKYLHEVGCLVVMSERDIRHFVPNLACKIFLWSLLG